MTLTAFLIEVLILNEHQSHSRKKNNPLRSKLSGGGNVDLVFKPGRSIL